MAAGANKDARTESGDTALLWAAIKNHSDIAVCLLRNGADINATNVYGSSPFLMAMKHGHRDMSSKIQFYEPRRDIQR